MTVVTTLITATSKRQLKFGGQSKFDVIFIDACYGKIVDEVICPVEAFALSENLKIIKEALTKNGSFFYQFLQFTHMYFRSFDCSIFENSQNYPTIFEKTSVQLSIGINYTTYECHHFENFKTFAYFENGYAEVVSSPANF